MPANTITKLDTIKQAFPKINQAIQDAFDAKSRATNADRNSSSAITKAKQAETSVNSVRAEISAVVGRATDSDAMSRQAAVNAEGIDKDNLKERLDDDYHTIQGKIDEARTDINDRGINVKSPPSPLVPAHGDGVTDDKDIIQAILDYANERKLSVFIPEGTYLLSQAIRLKEGAVLKLDNHAIMVRDRAFTMVQNGLLSDAFTGYEGNGNIVIDGGIWDLRGGEISGDGSAFGFGYAKNITVRNVTVRDVNFSHGIEICAIDGMLVENCRFEGFFDYTGNTRNYAEAIQIEHSSRGGFPYFGAGGMTPVKNVTIRNCYFGPSSNPSAMSWGVGVGSHSTDALNPNMNITIDNCIFDRNRYRGIRIQSWQNVKILNNTFEACETGIHYEGNLNLKSYVLIQGNIMKDINAYGILLDRLTSSELVANKIRSTNTALVINGCEDLSVMGGNEIYSDTSDAISCFSNVKRILINGNNIPYAGRHGINVYNNAFFIRVIENTFGDAVGNAINLSGANTQAVIVRENNIEATNVLNASAAVWKLHFTNNFYKTGGTINSTATDAIITPNYTY